MLDFPGEFCIFREEPISAERVLETSRVDEGKYVPGVNHVDSMLEGDLDDVVLGKVSTDRSQTLSDLVGFIRLEIGVLRLCTNVRMAR